MNVKRFTGRNSREAMQKVRQAFGDDAVVLSTKPAADGGIEIMAMGADGVAAVERMPVERHEPEVAEAPATATKGAKQGSARQAMASLANTVQDDVRQLAMSTLSFQDYVRERMLKRRQAALTSSSGTPSARTEPELAPSPQATQPAQVVQERSAAPRATSALRAQAQAQTRARAVADEHLDLSAPAVPLVPVATQAQLQSQAQAAMGAVSVGPQGQMAVPPQVSAPRQTGNWTDPAELTMQAMVSRTPVAPVAAPVDTAAREALVAAQAANASMLGELRAMRAMMKERFETIAFVDKLQRTPAQANMAQKLLDGGFSPVLIRKMLDGMPADVNSGQRNEMDWATMVLERNLNTADAEPNIEDQGGIFALIGSTGVGKTTTTAKLAGLCARTHGPGSVGLITLDTYRVGAHQQLRAYGKMLGVVAHLAHDRVALQDLLGLLSNRKMVLIDTTGLAPRDPRKREIMDLLDLPNVKRLLVLNAGSHGDTLDEAVAAFKSTGPQHTIFSKTDEAVKLGPAIDAAIRNQLVLRGVTTGQRVPEDWEAANAPKLVRQSMRTAGISAYDPKVSDLGFYFGHPTGQSAIKGRLDA